MKRIQKISALQKISEILFIFNKNYSNKFLYPGCLNSVDLLDCDNITKAHILPESSGGKLISWLCKKCNSQFGQNQDRWFSEYLNIKKSNSLFSDQSTKHAVYIDGLKINGNMTHDEKGISFFIDQKRNSPTTLNKLLSEYKSSFDLSITLPILSKNNDIDLGYITAAYLYCFNLFGYSWVLQSHLNEVRSAMKNNDIRLIKSVHVSKIDITEPYPELCFGFALVNGDYIPIVKVIDHIVFFPPFYNCALPQSIKEKNGKFNIDIRMITGLKDKNYSIPFILTIDNKVIFYPNHQQCTCELDNLLLIDSKSFEFKLLRKRKISELNKIKTDSTCKTYNIEINRN